MNKFDFVEELNERLIILKMSYDDIKAIDVKVSKRFWIEEKLIIWEFIFNLPIQHIYKELVKIIVEI